MSVVRIRIAAAVAVLLLTSVASAQVDARHWFELRARSQRLDTIQKASGGAIVEARSGSLTSKPPPFGSIALSTGFFVARGTETTLLGAATDNPAWRFHYSPPRRPLLDKAAELSGVNFFREQTGGTGEGVVIGIVDTGVDVSHPDLRTADGASRIAWWIDFSRSPLGLHPDLEERFGCSDRAGLRCAILNNEDIDALLTDGRTSNDPTDAIGHGTHVASLALGNGLGSNPPRYVGMAPEASLIVARVTDTSAAIEDADILLATEFIFERAESMGMPSVVNLSLGSDFGPHDGSEALGRALAAYVNRSQAGRAIVVAAGNSASLLDDVSGYPGPFGVHTEVHVADGQSIRVPLLTPRPPGGGASTRAALFVWLNFRDEDELSVSVERADGSPLLAPVGPGETDGSIDGNVEILALNGSVGEDSPLTRPNGAVLAIDGTWDSGRTFVIRLKGHGTANLWVQSEGQLSPVVGSVGAVFPRATVEQTVNIPAAHPGLIAVGASVNRTTWTSRQRDRVTITAFGNQKSDLLDSMAFFSSAGPTALGTMKPDLVAPGAFIAGAMSRQADPLTSATSMFWSPSFCNGSIDCSVVDAEHAVTMGTSMAAPLVSGAIALLFERDPSMTQAEVLDVLQAGARRLLGPAVSEQQVGVGALDVAGALQVQQSSSGETPSSSDTLTPKATESWIALSSSFLHPDPNWPLTGRVQLRATGGEIAVDVAESELTLSVQTAQLKQPLRRVAPGSWAFELRGLPETGGGTAHVTLQFRDEVLLSRRIPIAVDSSVAKIGTSPQGGCTLGPARHSAGTGAFLVLWVAGCLASRRRRRAASRVRHNLVK